MTTAFFLLAAAALALLPGHSAGENAGAVPAAVVATQPGLAVALNPQALGAFSAIASSLGHAYVKSLEPVKLPTVTKQELEVKITLSNASLTKIGWTTLDATAANVAGKAGMKLQVTGLSFDIAYTLKWKGLVIHGTHTGVGSISKSSADLFFMVAASADGRLSVTMLPEESTVSINNLNLGFSGIAKEIAHIVHGLVEDALDDEIPKVMAPIANAQLAAQLAELPLELEKFDIKVDLRVLGVVASAAGGLQVQFSGKATPAKDPAAVCPYSYDKLPAGNQVRDVEIAVAESTLQCGLWALQVSGGLQALAAAELAQYLTLDNRLSFGLAYPFLGTNELVIADAADSWTFNFPVQLFWDRLFGKRERYITVDALVKAVAQIEVAQWANLTIVLNGDLSLLQLAKVNVSQYAADVPAEYVEDIKHTDFAKLEAEANELIATAALPKINALLKGIPLIPEAYAAAQIYLRKTELAYDNGVLILGTDLVPL